VGNEREGRQFVRFIPMKWPVTLLITALFFFLPVWSLFAQKPANAPAPTPTAVDSTKLIRSAADTIPGTVQRNGVQVKTSPFKLDDASTTLDKPDTTYVTAKQDAKIHKIIPKQATMRSVMLPGLGQAYNRQYYKIPFIYVGFGVMGYLFVKYRGLAKEAETGYRRLLYGDKLADAYPAMLPPGYAPALITQAVTIPAYIEPVTEVTIGIDPLSDKAAVFRTTAGAKNVYDTFRRYRDLNILLSVVLYAVNIVEANVAAHLKTFDLTDDISMKVEPNVLTIPGTGFVPGVRVAFTFK
jgi:hypothetical protein